MAARAVFGGELAWVADNSEFSSALLAHRFPHVKNLYDISGVDWEHETQVDILVAGFPCQPVSAAGRRLGESDERWLWPEVFRAICCVRPRIALLENVSAILHRGAGTVFGDLAAAGYEFRYRCVRASDAGAPHRRERWFCLASDPGRARLEGAAPGSDSARVPPEGDRQALWGVYEAAIQKWEGVLGRSAPYPMVRSRTGKLRLSPTFVEWMMGLPEGWVTDVPGLTYRGQLHLLGNGVVPQQAELAFRLLLADGSLIWSPASGV